MGAVINLIAPVFPFILSGLRWIGTWLGISLTTEAARTVTLKIFLFFLFTTVLPLVLQKFLLKLALKSISLIVGDAPTAMHAIVFTLTGLGAWVADSLYLPSALGIYLGFAAYKFSLKMMSPITRW